jgi:hypothetical protein
MNGAKKPSMMDGAKKLWGVGQPKGFKLAAWGVAIVAAIAINSYSGRPMAPSADTKK